MGQGKCEVKCDRYDRLTDVFMMPKIAEYIGRNRFDAVNLRLLAHPTGGSETFKF